MADINGMADFLKRHRQMIDRQIRREAPGQPIDDKERELWVCNDETLYLQAQREGVEV